METKTIRITPEMANEILTNSKSEFKNRKVRQATVEMYANDMKNGNWKDNGETIKITSDGVLIDGQHRLHAICMCGIPQEMIVVEGISPEVIDTIDIGLKRSLENALQFQGRAYEIGASSVVRQRMTLRRGNFQMGQSNANMRISMVEQTEEFEKNDSDYIAATQYGKQINKESGKALNYPEVAAIYLYLTKDLEWESDYVKGFFMNLVNSSRGGKSIYSKTVNNLQNKSVCKGMNRLKEYILCWNAMIHGCTTQRPSYSEWFETPPQR